MQYAPATTGFIAATQTTSPSVDGLTQQFGTISLRPMFGPACSRVFLAPTNKSYNARSSVEAKLLELFKIFKNECSSTFNQVFYYVHQRLAPVGNIKKDHQGKDGVLAQLVKRMEDAWKKARELYEYIPFMNDAEGQIAALSCMQDIELLAFSLSDKTQSLRAVLTDDYSQALELYKSCVAECEKLTGLYTVEGKVQKLGEIIGCVESQFATQKPYPEVLDLLFLFMRYTASSLVKEIPQTNSALQATLVEYDRRIKQKISVSYVDLDVKDAMQEDPQLPENIHLAASETVVLPSENKFRGNGWANTFTTLSYVGRYSKISNQKDSLEAIAKAIYSLERSFQTCICEASSMLSQDLQSVNALSLAVDKNIAISIGLQRLVAVQFRKLKEVPIAPEIHAGWNYASSLLAHAKSLQASMESFKQKIPVFVAHAHAVKMLIHSIQEAQAPAKDQSELLSCIRLWAATRAACAVPRDLFTGSSIYTVVCQTLGQMGFRTLGLTLAEKEVVQLKGPWMSTEIVPVAILPVGIEEVAHTESPYETYIIKGIMRLLHFPQNQTRMIDVEFQKMFYTLKFDPKYRDSFKECLAISHGFRALHDAYIGKHERLYAYLMQCQYNADAEKQLEAYNGICENIEEPSFDKTPLVGVVKILLHQWLLRCFEKYCSQPEPQGIVDMLIDAFDSERIEITFNQKVLLTSFFEEYQSDPEQKKFWLDLNGVQYMEKLFLAFNQRLV